MTTISHLIIARVRKLDMANSLQEQLLKAGLVSERQVQDAKRGGAQARKQTKKPPKKARPPQAARPVDGPLGAEHTRDIARQRAAKIARDRALNQDREADRERRAKWGQVRQILDAHSQNDAGADVPFHYLRGKRIKRTYVTAAQRDALVTGRLVLVVLEGNHYLLAPDLGARVVDLLPEAYLHRVDGDAAGSQPADVDADDPYADYKVPDDLMW